MKLIFYSLRSRIFLSITAIVLLFSFVLGWISITQQTFSLENALIERGQITSRHLAYGVELGILTQDLSSLGKLLNKVLKENDVLYAEIYNSDGEMIVSSGAHEETDIIWHAPNLNMDSAGQSSKAMWMKGSLNHQPIYEFQMPVISEISAVEESMLLDEAGDSVEQTIGLVHIAFSAQSIRTATRKTIRDGIASFVVLLLLALIVAWWLARALTRPLEHISDIIETTKSGEFNQRIHLVGQNEITQLGMAFNRMLEALEERDNKLHTQQRTMQVVLDAAPIGIWMLGKDRRVSFANKAFASAVGIPEQAFLDATHYVDLLPEEAAKYCIESDNRCFETACLITSQEPMLCADGKVHVFDIVKAPLQNEKGEMIGLVGIAIDATERLEAGAEKEQMQKQVEHTQRLESLGVLAGGIAHDFNNILTSIMGNAALAERKLKNAFTDADKYLSNIVHSTEKAALLCRQMLAYSGKGHFIVQPINLSQMVGSVTSLLEVSLHGAIELKYQLSDQLSNINADEAQLQQVIMNLVINASDSIEGRTGVITISTGEMYADSTYLAQLSIDPGIQLEAGNYVYMEVSDTGCGMDKETQQRIFEPFFTTKFTGRGLGMSAVQGIIRGHHGAMCLYSEPNQGTTFKILFPASDQSQTIISPSSKAVAEKSSCRGTVLIIDDEEMIREIASEMLQHLGFETLTAVDGLDGIDVYRQHQENIIVVLLDMTMPRLDGAGCFQKLRSINKNVKVILSSGYSEKDATSSFNGKGLAGFVQKPYLPDILEEAIRKVSFDHT